MPTGTSGQGTTRTASRTASRKTAAESFTVTAKKASATAALFSARVGDGRRRKCAERIVRTAVGTSVERDGIPSAVARIASGTTPKARSSPAAPAVPATALRPAAQDAAPKKKRAREGASDALPCANPGSSRSPAVGYQSVSKPKRRWRFARPAGIGPAVVHATACMW